MPIFGLVLTAAHAGVIDRIAVVVHNRAVKDSDIARDIRINGFLNGGPVTFDLANRKMSASRLIDQELIRAQIRNGAYAVARMDEAEAMLASLKKDRFNGDAAYRRTLQQAGITEAELQERLLWQLTVLRFIDARFRPAAIVSDSEAAGYYEQHQAELKMTFPNSQGIDDVRDEINRNLSAAKIDKLLDDWLAQQRQDARIEYLEADLK